jgi:hypothetical protein
MRSDGGSIAVAVPRFAVFPRRPSSDRVTDRRSSLAVAASYRVLAEPPCPPPRAPLLRFPTTAPPRIFSGVLGMFRLRCAAGEGLGRLPASVDVSSLGSCRPMAMDAYRVTSLALGMRAAKVACVLRSRVCFAAGGLFLFRGRDSPARFLTRRRTARRTESRTRRRMTQASHRLSTAVNSRLSPTISRGSVMVPRPRKSCPRPSTGCGWLAVGAAWATRSTASDRGSSRPLRLSAIQCGKLPSSAR